MLRAALYIASYKWNIDKIRLAGCQDRRELTQKIWAKRGERTSSFSSEMEVAKLSAPLNLEVRLVSCNESAIKRWLNSELEETVFSTNLAGIAVLSMTEHTTNSSCFLSDQIKDKGRWCLSGNISRGAFIRAK